MSELTIIEYTALLSAGFTDRQINQYSLKFHNFFRVIPYPVPLKTELDQLRQLCREQHEALRILHPKQSVWRTPTDEQAESIEKAIEKYHSITETI